MKVYKITISGKEIEIIQNEDGSFIKPDIVKELESYGTALKPAFEPICMAMKPLSEKNFIANVLKYGTGGINIDESRVEAKPRKTGTKATSDEATGSGNTLQGSSKNRHAEYDEQNLGRFPANLITDGSEEVRECFPDTKSGSITKDIVQNNAIKFNASASGVSTARHQGDSGNASRFFKSIIYTAKASKSERNKGCEELEDKQTWASQEERESNSFDVFESDGRPKTLNKNNHPTVKPIALMSYLIKMITPKGGIVLDPFSGSGSTLVAAKENGFDFIGIEKEPEYIKIIEARTGIKAEIFKTDEIIKVPEIKQDKVEVKSGLSKCCNAKIIKGYCEMCCEKV
jgi:hypothetical protein